MPSGKVHALTTCVTAGVLSPLIYLAGQGGLGYPSIPAALAFAGGCMLGLVVTPDLDVRLRDTHAETIMRRAGSCLGIIWNLFWMPYAWLIPCHRHPLSHWPVLGTALRLLYLLVMPMAIWWGLRHFMYLPALPQLALNPFAWWAIGGLALVDAIHWGLDGVF